MSRIYTFPTFIHSGGISVSCVYYGFLYFCQLLSFIAVVFIFYLLVIFPSQIRIRVNIKVVQCLKYRVSLVPSRSVLRRNSDNNIGIIQMITYWSTNYSTWLFTAKEVTIIVIDNLPLAFFNSAVNSCSCTLNS